jgi:hypothetical protein
MIPIRKVIWRRQTAIMSELRNKFDFMLSAGCSTLLLVWNLCN